MIFSRKQQSDSDHAASSTSNLLATRTPSEGVDSPIEISDDDQSLLAEAFESTGSIFRLLSTLRTRRVGLGYSIETGNEETFAWSSRRTVHQAKGPLSHHLEVDAVPLTEIEEALICWAGIGPNGSIVADIPVNGALSGQLHSQGRTIPASSNDLATDLFIVNDSGVSIYRPTVNQPNPIEITNPDDYWKILAWYRNCRTVLSNARPDVGWFSAPEGTQSVNPMGPGQYNINRPGSTWLIPIYDVGIEWFNQLLISYDWSGFYLMDPDTAEPAGCKEWICPGFLEAGFPIPAFDELALLLGSSQAACSVQNIRLAGEALGIGAWPVGSYADDLLLGAYPEISKGLGFSFLDRTDTSNPTKTTTCLGLPGVKEAVVVPSPRFPDARSAVKYVKELRYNLLDPPLSNMDHFASNSLYKQEISQDIASSPKFYISDWAEEACVATVEYIVDKYGCCPAFVNPVRAKFSVQLHHIDQSFYRKYQIGSPSPYAITSTIESHFSKWHCGADDPSTSSATASGSEQ